MPLVAVVATFAVTSCGSDETATLTLVASDPSPKRVELEAPKTFDAGEISIELRNEGDVRHDAQLFRVDGRHSAAEIVGVLEDMDIVPRPGWLHPAGGVAATSPGETAAVTQVLAPGTYYVADTQERPTRGVVDITNAVKGGIVRIEVRGDGGGELPSTRATIVASDSGYETKGIVAGTNRVTFRNAGREHHQAVALPVRPGVPLRKLERELLDRLLYWNWVPVAVPHDRATAALEAGGEQVTELSFRPGRYLLLCFVSDWDGGPAQWREGMLSELEVPATADGQ